MEGKGGDKDTNRRIQERERTRQKNKTVERRTEHGTGKMWV